MSLSQIESRIRRIEDHAALKQLVDRFAILADEKSVHAQTLLFTPDATVETWFGETALPLLRGRREIEASWTPFLARFDRVYHQSGQFLAEINGDSASAVHYCTVELIHGPEGAKIRNSNGVIYHDSYLRQNGGWLIAKRIARFNWRDHQPLTPAMGGGQSVSDSADP